MRCKIGFNFSKRKPYEAFYEKPGKKSRKEEYRKEPWGERAEKPTTRSDLSRFNLYVQL